MITSIPIQFEGCFSDIMKTFIQYKRSLGLQYDRPEYDLVRFSRFLVENNVTDLCITQEIAEKWCCKRECESNKCWTNRIGIYNQFAVYLNSVGYSAYILPKPKNRYNEYVPHIFTEEEINRIYYAADKINAKRLNSYQRIMPVLVRLLFSTGLRISEAINLKCSDIDFTTGILYLYDCKNGEDRIVPMHQTLLEYLKEYANKYIYDNEYFFETIHHTQITAATCYKKFRDILFSAGIPHGGRGKGPRLHDTRHSFAVHSLRHMINQGMDIYVSLPYLSVYLGHKSIVATENYIRLTAEAYPELAALVNKYTGHVIPEV